MRDSLKKYVTDSLHGFWNRLKEIGVPHSDKTASIPFGQVDSTSTSTVFTATVDGITELRDGVCCYLKNGVVTSYTGCTLNINSLGAKPMYYTTAAASRVTTHFNIAYTWLFVYNSSRVSGGCWDCYWGYDSNTNSIAYQIRHNNNGGSLPLSTQMAAYRLVFTSADGTKYIPANSSSSTSGTTVKTPTTEEINPFGEILYYFTTTLRPADSTIDVGWIWNQYQDVRLGNSFNNTGSALTLTAHTPVYLKCTPQSDGGAIIDANEPFTQSLPSTEDGKIYIFLGLANSATTIELLYFHPVYYYKDGAIREWTNAAETDVSGKADKVSGATSGNFAGLDANGNLTDSGYDYSDFLSSSTVIPTVGTLNTNNSTAQTVSSSESFGGTINLHKVAKTGTYSDLIGTPTIPDISGKADKVTSPTSGDFAGLDSNGNLTDSGSKASDFATSSQAVPSGGTTGQVLTKHSNTDNDVEWATIPVPELSIDVTYNEILALKNSHSLVPGATYRITDYKCTWYNSVSDAYWNTRNGGLFIKALTDRTLSEDGELVLLANNVTVEVAAGVNETIPYKKQVCSVKYTTDNIDGLSSLTEVTVVDTTILFDPSAPQDLIELSTPPTFTYVRDTVYDEPPISIYSFEINGTTYYINGNSIASTDGSTLFSTGYSGEMEGINLSYNSEFSGILVRDNGTYYYTMTGPTVYNTGETAEIDGDTFEIFSESLPYAAGDDCYLIGRYYFETPGNGVCNYGHYDTANDTWVYSSVSVTQKMLRRDEEHIECSGKGSIYHMVDDYGNEAIFDFKGRLTNNGNFYLGTTMYNYENGEYTNLDVKVDRSSTSDDLFINNILLNENCEILDLYDVWRIDDSYMDYSSVQGCKFYNTGGGISGYRQIYRTNFEGGSVDNSQFGENSYISDLEINMDSEYHTVVFKKTGAIDSLVSNIEVKDDDSIELTETGGQVEAAYNSDYNYRVVKIPALTRISIEPNTDTSMINNYCSASCLLNGEPYDGDTYGYVACVFIEGDARRYGYFKLGDWDGSSTLVYVTLKESYLCLNVYYEQDDQDLGSNDSIFTINDGDLYVNNGYGNRAVSGDYLTRERVLENALDVVSCGTTRVATSQTSGGMLPNVMYNLGTLSSDTTFSLAAASDNSVANVWSWTFSIGSTVPNLTWPSTGITVWEDGAEPSAVANTYYEINVMNGIAIAYTVELPSI